MATAATRMQDLTEEDVRRRLATCTDKDVVDELYAFGLMLTNETIDRLGKLDGKANSLAAYCGAIITLLVSTIGIWSSALGQWTTLLPIVGATLAALAAILALSATTQRTTEWFSQDDWMNADCLSDYRRLKGFQVLTMWGVLSNHRNVSREKSRLLKRAQWLSISAIFFLYLSLLKIAWRYAAL